MNPSMSFPRSRFRQRGGALAWILGGIAAMLLLGMLALVALGMSGWNMFAEQARVAVQAQPEVLEHIGTIREFDFNMTETGEAEGSDEFVFDLVGSKGKGRLRAHFVTIDADHEALGSGSLILPDGRTIAFDGGAR